MLAPPPPPQLTSFILTTILISFYIPTSLSQQQFQPNCAILYSCGQNIQRIGYPFWGQNRNPNCGLPGFQLNCLELVQDNTTTIVINSQIYRVLEINQNDHKITIARHNICPVVSTDRTLNDTLFGYDSDQVQFLDLYYSCPSSFNIPTRDTIRCSGNGNTDGTGFYLNQTFSSADVQVCEISVGVPVNRTLFREFEESERISLQELIASGVRVEYKYDVGACLKCEESDGFCWSGTNTSEHSCLCRDGVRFGDCSARSRPLIVVKITVGLVCGGGSIASIILYFYCRKSSFIDSLMFWKSTKNDNQIEAFITQYGFSTPKRYKFFEIKKMTNLFKDELGKGGFGSVFKGMLQDGSLVAIKVMKESKGNGEEFINEVASIGKTSHVNIVALLGFCYEGKKRALVYEFMPNGSLEKFINHKLPTEGTQQHLGVEKLFEIAVGIARGLEYLHRGCTTRILHFDIKPHNILLNKDFCPKISDFGLAKIHSREESIMSMVEARGTIGYIAPEVFNRNFGGVSHKSDVYSYGMMVLEIVGGRKNIITRPNHSSEIYFPQWIYKQLELEEDLRMPIMENEIARKMIIVGLWCIQPNPTERPPIRKVVEMLEGTIDALQIPPNPIFSPPPHLPVTSSIILESSISFE